MQNGNILDGLKSRVDTIMKILSEKKAEDIVCVDMTQKPYITQYVVISTAMVGKHAYALLDALKTELKPKGEHFFSIDEESEDWIIVDLGDIMVHIFTENHRKKFNLEDFLQQNFIKDIKNID